jgi:hypothetical protein
MRPGLSTTQHMQLWDTRWLLAGREPRVIARQPLE